MTVYINGTTGISGVDGSAATPALQGADSNTGISFGTDTVTINTGGVARVTTDSSGNVGLGVTPSAWEASAALQLGNNYSYSKYGMGRNYYYDGSTNRYIASAAAGTYQISGGGVHAWSIAPSGTAGNAISFTQAMTLDASGNLLVGTTSNTLASRAYFLSAGGTHVIGAQVGSDGNYALGVLNASGTVVGGVVANASSTTYSTSSDYRLKEQVAPITGALAKNELLNPVTYKWKVDGSDGQGFIAHELQAVFPDAVTGEKDAVDDEGKPVYQGVDTSFLVGHLVACVKELKAELDSVKAELATLKGAA